MTEEQGLLKTLFEAVVDCDDDASGEAAQAALEGGAVPEEVIDTAIRAIGQVGDDFGAGKIFIPELMLAGMGLEKVMAQAQKKLLASGQEAAIKGVLVMGSVAGDVHNIGKDLVITMWRANGYQVYDLGVDVPRARFVSAAQELKADIVALSALMSTTLPEMSEVIELFKVMKVRDDYKIIVGGGVCTQEWSDEIGADGYAEDAAGAVKLVDSLIG